MVYEQEKNYPCAIGVGTVDQTLLAVLQVKHVFVRLFGLANKTVIIDEVHAYDAYMSTLLERLLEWLAALGSPVIILSATLPKSKRDSFVYAYLRGGGIKDGICRQPVGEDKYPRLSFADVSGTSGKFNVRHVVTPQERLLVEWHNDDSLADELKTQLENGGCAAVICNTVQKAQDTYKKLAGFFQKLPANERPVLDLLHSRFLYYERKEREERCLKRFSKPDKDGESRNRPYKSILVATQIIEQSLDLDFDLMVSEIAPVDLLLQRSGRLQRHKRKYRPPAFRDKDGKDRPTLWLLKPPTDINDNLLIDDKGMPGFGYSGLIYDKHILLRTWLILRHKFTISVPDEIEELIENVYEKGRACDDKVYLDAWKQTSYLLENKRREKEFKAKAVRLTETDDDEIFESFKFQLDEDDPAKHATLRAQTRDDERPSVSVVVLTKKEVESINTQLPPDKDLEKFLIYREVKLSRQGVTQDLIANPEFKVEAWNRSTLLRHHRLIVIDEINRKPIGSTILRLDADLGIVYEPTGGESE